MGDQSDARGGHDLRHLVHVRRRSHADVAGGHGEQDRAGGLFGNAGVSIDRTAVRHRAVPAAGQSGGATGIDVGSASFTFSTATPRRSTTRSRRHAKQDDHPRSVHRAGHGLPIGWTRLSPRFRESRDMDCPQQRHHRECPGSRRCRHRSRSASQCELLPDKRAGPPTQTSAPISIVCRIPAVVAASAFVGCSGV